MTWKIRLRDREECNGDLFLSPDLVIKSDGEFVTLDFALAEARERFNKGGLRSREALHTGILIQLFTDGRALDDEPLPDDLDPNRRGWWGDSVARVSEQGSHNIGSRLWTLRRARLTAETAQIANDMTVACLQPFIDQGAVASFDVQTRTSYASLSFGKPETGILEIGIDGYAQDSTRIYSQQFSVLWDQIRDLRR